MWGFVWAFHNTLEVCYGPRARWDWGWQDSSRHWRSHRMEQKRLWGSWSVIQWGAGEGLKRKEHLSTCLSDSQNLQGGEAEQGLGTIHAVGRSWREYQVLHRSFHCDGAQLLLCAIDTIASQVALPLCSWEAMSPPHSYVPLVTPSVTLHKLSPLINSESAEHLPGSYTAGFSPCLAVFLSAIKNKVVVFFFSFFFFLSTSLKKELFKTRWVLDTALVASYCCAEDTMTKSGLGVEGFIWPPHGLSPRKPAWELRTETRANSAFLYHPGLAS